MKRMMRKGYGICVAGVTLFALARLVVAQAVEQQVEKIPVLQAVDPEAYNEFMSSQVSDINDLDVWFREKLFNWLQIVPPAEDFILRQPSGELLPFDWKKFPSGFTKNLVSGYLNSVPAFKIVIAEDRQTRSTFFYNEKGDLVFSLPAEPGYNPQWFLKETRPDLFSGRYTPSYVDWMSRFYDPARVQLEVTIIPDDYAEDYLYVKSRLATESASQALTSSSGSGSVLMSYQGPPVTNLCFTTIELITNFIRVTIAYPYDGATYPTNCFTNRLDVFHSSNLLESWWDLATTTNVSASTNWIEWTDKSVTASWVVVRFYAAGNADIDSDGDGFADARERFMYHSDPNDQASHPASVSGSVSYNGSETGMIYALATFSSNSWSLGCSASIPSPGSYTNNDVATQRSYWFKAFQDANANLFRDDWEPYGLYSSSSTYVTSNLSGVNMTLQDVPSIWGTLTYSGTATGNIYVVAVTASNSFDTTYHCLIPWVQGGSEMTGGETYVTFPVNYSIIGVPASNYWIRAFIDEDTNQAYTHLEVAGQYTSNAIPVSNRVTGISFTLDQDSDGDGMSDDMEVRWGFNPAVSNAFQRLPWFAGFETAEGYTAGDLNNQKGWNVGSGGVVVQGAKAATGTQAARWGSESGATLASANHFVVARTNAVVWTDMRVKMLPGELPVVTNSYANLAAVFMVAPSGYLAAYDGSTGGWTIASNSWKVQRGAWLHLTVKQDYAAKKWSLFRDGMPVFTELGFADRMVRQLARINVEGSERISGYLDDLNVAPSMFTHVDSDSDGIPNSQEDADGDGVVDPTETDPFNADTDGDGIDDGQEQALGFSPTTSNSYSHVPWTVGFEGPEGYSNGELNGQQGWLASSSVVVQSSVRYAGTNAARITSSTTGNAGMTHYVVGQSESVVWFEMYAKLQPGGLPDVDAAPSNSVLAAVNREGVLCAYNRENQSWVQAQAGHEVSSNTWTRLTVRVDYIHKTWDMYIGPSLIFVNVPFADDGVRHLSRLKISIPCKDSVAEESYVDSLTLTPTEPTDLDNDADGMCNAWERQYGLNPNDGLDRYDDTDGDGLVNIEEYRIGTDPTRADTDSDGIDDYTEAKLALSDPLIADFNGASIQDVLIQGSSFTNAGGSWERYGNTVYALSRGGFLDYSMAVPSNGYYVLEVQATEFDPNAENHAFEFRVSVDSTPVGRGIMDVEFGVRATNNWFLPYLASGSHSMRLSWDYRLNNGSPRIIALRLLRLGGPDTNANGVADWIDHRRANVLDPDMLPAVSYISPVCYEGKSGLFEALHLTSTYNPGGVSPTLKKGILNNWYANVPLSRTNTISVTITGDNTAIAYTNSIAWQEFNILSAPTGFFVLRTNDALLLNAKPTGATNGVVTIEVVDVTNITTTVTNPVLFAFATSGYYTVRGTWTGATVSNGQIQVQAVSARFNGSPIAYFGRIRTWDCPTVPTGTVVEVDPRMTVQSSPLAGGGVRFTLGVDGIGHRGMVARLGVAGPVLDSTEVVGVDVYSSDQLSLQTLHTYSDGTKLIEMVIHVTEIPAGMSIRIEAFTSPVTLLDGSMEVILTAQDFDENGEARVCFVMAPGWVNGVCHGLSVYQDGSNIGAR